MTFKEGSPKLPHDIPAYIPLARTQPHGPLGIREVGQCLLRGHALSTNVEAPLLWEETGNTSSLCNGKIK